MQKREFAVLHQPISPLRVISCRRLFARCEPTFDQGDHQATMPPVKPLVARPPLSFVEAKRQEVRTASKPAENATCKFATSAVSGICCVWYSALDLLCGPCGCSPGAPPGSTSIFNAGENGYFTFRIPALPARSPQRQSRVLR